MRVVILPLLLTLLPSPISRADTGPATYNRVHLSTSAQAQVKNDTVVAVLFAQAQSHDLARASDLVNRQIGDALGVAKAHRSVKVQTLEYQTTPIYQNGKPSGEWLVRQAMRLESRESQALSALLGKLQQSLAIRSLGYQLSDQARLQLRSRLTRQAIEAFKERARRITEIWGSSGFRLVEMHISDGGSPPPRPQFRAAEASLARAAPAIEAGEQTISVTVQGVIELQE
ncbi:MAG: SIMPL domain-containing protein [Gammaproteobacteria bacterium]